MGFKTKITLKGCGVGIGDRYITRLHGDKTLMGFEIVIRGKHARTDQLFLENLYKVEQILRVAITDIVYLIRWHRQTVFSGLALGSTMYDALHTLYNIVDIGKVTLAVAIIEYLNVFSFYQLIGETEVSHIGSAGRSVNGKETKTGTRNVIELAVGMSHQFVALLGGGIKADRVIHLVIGAVGNLLVTAINRTGRGINKMAHTTLSVIVTMPAGFKDVIETDQVTLDIGIGVGDAVADTGLSRQVDHHIKVVVGKKAVDKGFIGKVALYKSISAPRMPGCYLLQTVQTVFLDLDVVIVVHTVETDNADRAFGGKQPFH